MDNNSAAKWRTIALLSLITMVPVCWWCRAKALAYEPEVLRLRAVTKDYESRLKELDGKLFSQKQAAAAAHEEMRSKLAQAEKKHKQELSKKNAYIASLEKRNAEARKLLANRPVIKVQAPKETYPPYSSYSEPIQGSLGDEQSYPRSDPDSSWRWKSDY